ncbi:MAG: S8 family serine peptidase [Vulcanimicrobiota bacterium]
MKNKLSILLLLVFCIVLFSLSDVLADETMIYYITLKEDAPEDFAESMEAVLDTCTCSLEGEPDRYKVTVLDTPKIEAQYDFLFNNIPAISMVNDQKVKPNDETILAQCPPVSTEVVIPGTEPPTTKPDNDYVKGEVLLKLKDGNAKTTIKDINTVFGTKVLEYIDGIQVYRLKVPEGRTAPAYEKMISMSPKVEYVELNRKMQAY